MGRGAVVTAPAPRADDPDPDVSNFAKKSRLSDGIFSYQQSKFVYVLEGLERNIYLQFDTCYGHLVYFVLICHILPCNGGMFTKKYLAALKEMLTCHGLY
jgi:hypothetical protein